MLRTLSIFLSLIYREYSCFGEELSVLEPRKYSIDTERYKEQHLMICWHEENVGAENDSWDSHKSHLLKGALEGKPTWLGGRLINRGDIKSLTLALTGVAQWVGHRTTN